MLGMFALNNKIGNTYIRKISNLFEFDYKEEMIGLVRGFPGNKEFL